MHYFSIHPTIINSRAENAIIRVSLFIFIFFVIYVQGEISLNVIGKNHLHIHLMFAILSPFISSYYGWNWEIKVQYLWKVSLQSFNLKHFMQKVLHLASTKLSWLNISVFFWSPMYLLPWINASRREKNNFISAF